MLTGTAEEDAGEDKPDKVAVTLEVLQYLTGVCKAANPEYRDPYHLKATCLHQASEVHLFNKHDNTLVTGHFRNGPATDAPYLAGPKETLWAEEEHDRLLALDRQRPWDGMPIKDLAEAAWEICMIVEQELKGRTDGWEDIDFGNGKVCDEVSIAGWELLQEAYALKNVCGPCESMQGSSDEAEGNNSSG